MSRGLVPLWDLMFRRVCMDLLLLPWLTLFISISLDSRHDVCIDTHLAINVNAYEEELFRPVRKKFSEPVVNVFPSRPWSSGQTFLHQVSRC
jgi:hypothetical protein